MLHDIPRSPRFPGEGSPNKKKIASIYGTKNCFRALGSPASQSRVPQSKRKPSRAMQSNAKQSKAGRAGPGQARPGRAGPGWAGPGRAGLGRAGPGWAGPGLAGPGQGFLVKENPPNWGCAGSNVTLRAPHRGQRPRPEATVQWSETCFFPQHKVEGPLP